MKKNKIKEDLLNQIAKKTEDKKNFMNTEKSQDHHRILSDTLKITNDEKTAKGHITHEQ